MVYLIYKNAQGVERIVPNGSKRFKDEVCVGRIIKDEQHRDLIKELDAELGKGGKGPGDWIKAFLSPIAKKLGKSRCTACEARRVATNAYAVLKAKYGMVEALRVMKELWEMSFTAKPDEVLIKLKEYLDAECRS